MRFIRTGFCCTCGDCCDTQFDEIRDKAYVNAGVAFKGVNRDKENGCSLFNEKTRLCKDYENRPSSCRRFPLLPVEITFLPRCTFTFQGEKVNG